MGRVYLLRHVESEANRDGVGLGHEDSPPTELGLRQRAATAEALAGAGIARVLTSPLTRARTLAEAIAEASGAGVGVEPREELLELDVGELEGLPFSEARERYGDFMRAWRGEGSARVPFPGGESLAQLQARAWPAVEGLVLAEGGGDVAVVSHNFVVRVLLARVLGMPVEMWRRVEAGLASISVVRADPAHPAVERLNDRSHLAGIS